MISNIINNPYPVCSEKDEDGISIELSLNIHAHHGVLEQERIIGGDFRVSLQLLMLECDTVDALVNDKLSGTINYAEVYELVKKEISVPSALLEHVAMRICRVLIYTYSCLQNVKVAVTKVVPPINGFDGKGITVSRSLRRRLVIWDFDGTIADTSQGIVRTMSLTFEKCKYPVPSPDAICQTIGMPLTESIANLAGIEGEELARAVDCYRELFEEVGTQGVTLFPGVAEEMQRQKSLGFFVAIATSRGHESVEQLCSQLGVRQYIDYIVGCEDTQSHKPHPEPVFDLCRLSHTRLQDTIVIGDTTFDIEMGKNAHVEKTMGVLWGNHSKEQLCSVGADVLVANF